MPGVGNDQVIILRTLSAMEIAMEISDLMDEGWVLRGSVMPIMSEEPLLDQLLIGMYIATMTKKRDRGVGTEETPE